MSKRSKHRTSVLVSLGAWFMVRPFLPAWPLLERYMFLVGFALVTVFVVRFLLDWRYPDDH